MKIWLRKLIDTTSMMKTRQATADLLGSLSRDLGFDCYQVTIVRHAGLENFTLSNVPQEWVDKYWRERFDRIDPLLPRAREKMEPFIWSFAQEKKAARGAKRIFYSSALEAGLGAGISMPVTTPLNNLFIFTLFTGDAALPVKLRLQPVLTANAMALLHACVEATEAASPRVPIVELTGRQSTVIKWAAEGKTMKEIALIENMTYHNVNFHMMNVRRILNTVSLPQTTALATKLKLI